MIALRSFQPRLEGKVLLSPLSVTIEPGTFAVLSAPSGAGKSRLLETLTSGRLPFEGTFSIDTASVSIPQSLDLCRALTAAENVACARVSSLPFWKTIFGFPREELERARLLLRELGLAGIDTPTFRLSGGEQQRVALARLVNSDRRVWLMDEPVSQLDDRAAVACLEYVKAEARRRGAAVLCVLHQEKVAKALADRVFHWDQVWSFV